MTRADVKKEREFQSILPIMKELGYDEQEARNLITGSESPDFLFEYGDKTVGIKYRVSSRNRKGKRS
jgi:hypothetical protein